ncbi:GntR family transcriptional regulator [Allocatelliglobosispora scoriae]|uniref:GntR family transcriptional regulator n=1 Tax=Allocatelliglobosispora scoriae TaxID=643052 RepID=A0A841BPU8_9ACTN|nr:GntR family transcriptional regulator [Allocatelliglobosispora scoriae]MBB5871097.1 GntR family transcriptional regulator [Allocatelliglobosispora scoriae]
MELPQPKYVVVVNAIQQRIEDGTYQPGSAIPSEAALIAEFGVSRPTTVRALGILQRDGWLDAEQGKGRFVRSRASIASRQPPGQASTLLKQEERAGVKLLFVGPVLASPRTAAALEIEPGTPLIARQRIVTSEIGPIELGTSYIPVDLASGTGLGDHSAITEGLLQRLKQRKGVEFDHATERISARLPSEEEATYLEVDPTECLLTVLFTAFDRAGRPLFAVDVLVPASRRELEDAFPIH